MPVRSESFTIVTPCLNMGRFLRATIESVARNLGPDDEYFIVDGGSTDETLEIIKACTDRITWWTSEPDRGYGDALRKGFARSRAEFQCWINAGDLLLEGAVDQARRHLTATGADFIFGDDFLIDAAARVLGFSRGYVASFRDWVLFGGWTPLQDACFWRRSLYERVGGIDPGLQLAADYDLFLRFGLRGRCRYVPVAFSAFRQHEGQRSIVMASRYAEERQRCRQRALSAMRIWRVEQRLREAIFWVRSRHRDHILRPAWDLRRLHGLPVASLPSRSYGVAGDRTPPEASERLKPFR